MFKKIIDKQTINNNIYKNRIDLIFENIIKNYYKEYTDLDLLKYYNSLNILFNNNDEELVKYFILQYNCDLFDLKSIHILNIIINLNKHELLNYLFLRYNIYVLLTLSNNGNNLYKIETMYPLINSLYCKNYKIFYYLLDKIKQNTKNLINNDVGHINRFYWYSDKKILDNNLFKIYLNNDYYDISIDSLDIGFYLLLSNIGNTTLKFNKINEKDNLLLKKFIKIYLLYCYYIKQILVFMFGYNIDDINNEIKNKIFNIEYIKDINYNNYYINIRY